MINPSIDTTDDRLTAYALGELDEADRADFELLLASRPDLQQELKELEALAGMLRQELLAEPKLSLTAEQHQQVLGCASATPEPMSMIAADATRRRRIRRWAIIGAEVALAVAFTAGAIHYSTANRPTQSMVDHFHELKPGAANGARTDRSLVRLADSSGATTNRRRDSDRLDSLADAPEAYYDMNSAGSVTESKVVSEPDRKSVV